MSQSYRLPRRRFLADGLALASGALVSTSFFPNSAYSDSPLPPKKDGLLYSRSKEYERREGEWQEDKESYGKPKQQTIPLSGEIEITPNAREQIIQERTEPRNRPIRTTIKSLDDFALIFGEELWSVLGNDNQNRTRVFYNRANDKQRQILAKIYSTPYAYFRENLSPEHQNLYDLFNKAYLEAYEQAMQSGDKSIILKMFKDSNKTQSDYDQTMPWFGKLTTLSAPERLIFFNQEVSVLGKKRLNWDYIEALARQRKEPSKEPEIDFRRLLGVPEGLK